MRILLRWLIAALCGGMPGIVYAQTYPGKPIRLIVPYPPGASTNDILGRTFARRLSDELGVPVIVDNRAGAGGNVGSGMVAKAAPDGHTLLIGINGPLAIGPSMYSNLGYDPLKDLAPVAIFASVPFVLVVNPAVQATSIRELIALAKARPGQMNFAASGNGTTTHLCAELFKLSAGINAVHVPYNGGALAVLDLLGGQVQMYCTGLPSVISQIKAGKLRAVGLAALQRSNQIPDLPTINEQGLKGFEVNSWTGLLAPAKTPDAIIRRLYTAVARIVSDVEMKNFIVSQGAEPVLMDPQKFAVYLKAETAKWAKVVKAANIKAE